MKYLGLDLGEKRVGVAVGEGNLALPLTVLDYHDSDDLALRLSLLVKEHGAQALVAGEALRPSGNGSAQDDIHKQLAEQLSRQLGLPVYFIDERLTTKQAERMRSGVVDDLAAQLILQTYLDQQYGTA
ncbi:MAG: Holliday junction resolvase RuvX [bacterium]